MAGQEPGDPVSLRVQASSLEALNVAGVHLWTQTFAAPFPDNPTAGQELSNRSWIGDLDGDRRPEVLFLSTQPLPEAITV